MSKMTDGQIRTRIAELELANSKAPCWGAAVSARQEEIKGLRKALATRTTGDDNDR